MADHNGNELRADDNGDELATFIDSIAVPASVALESLDQIRKSVSDVDFFLSQAESSILDLIDSSDEAEKAADWIAFARSRMRLIAGEPPEHTLDEILPDDEDETYKPLSSIRPDLRDRDDESTERRHDGTPNAIGEIECPVCWCDFLPDALADHEADRPEWCTVNARDLIGFEDLS